MASSQEASQNENTYMVDSESAAEMARLMRQDHLLTQGMGGLFPERPDLSNIERILDIACGPGGWVMEVAFANPEIDVVGVDISQTMIEYARAQAKVQMLDNASFKVMNALKPLDFPDGSFDLVNTRFIVAFMLPSVWPKFVRECRRILSPGGVLRLTDLEWGFSNKAAFEKYSGLFSQALQKAGQSFSPNGLHMGITPMLVRILQDAGYQNIQKKAHMIDFSAGTEANEGFYQDLKVGFKLVQPFLTKWKVATQEEVDELYEQLLTEMRSDDFCAYWLLITAWGEKPE